MALLGPFDATTIEPRKDFGVLPAGEYSAMIVNSEMKETKAGTGQYLKVEMDISEGDFQGRKLFENLNLVNDNQIAVTIAQQTLAEICTAVNKPNIQDSQELHGIRFTVKVAVQNSTYKPGEQENVIKKYSVYNPATATETTTGVNHFGG